MLIHTFHLGNRIWTIHARSTCVLARIQKLCQRGQTLTFFVLFFMEGERIKMPLKADHYRPASKIQFKWCFAGGPMMAKH